MKKLAAAGPRKKYPCEIPTAADRERYLIWWVDHPPGTGAIPKEFIYKYPTPAYTCTLYLDTWWGCTKVGGRSLTHMTDIL